jgi:hypothetical protein
MTDRLTTEKSDELPLDDIKETVARFSDWVRFADAKAAGVLVLQALGLADLLRNAGRLSTAHEVNGVWADMATGSFWVALTLSVLVVTLVSAALFPRVTPQKDSVFFFGSASKYPSGSEYAAVVGRLSVQARFDQLADQAWELARVASAKYRRTRWAYWVALAFLGAWALARLALVLSV